MEASGGTQSSDLSRLQDIVEKNKEILELLDVIEERTKQQRESGGEENAVSFKYKQEIQQNDEHEDSKQSVEQRSSRGSQRKHIADTKSPRQFNAKIRAHKLQDVVTDRHDEPVIPHPSRETLGNFHLFKTETTRLGEMPGFSEKMILSEKQKASCKLMKRHKTVLEQDNRICVMFELPLVNKGCVYASQRLEDNPEPDKEMQARLTEPMKMRGKGEPETLKSRFGHQIAPFKDTNSRPHDKTSGKHVEPRPLKPILKKPGLRRLADHSKVDNRATESRQHSTDSRPREHGDKIERHNDTNIPQNFPQNMQASDLRIEKGKQILTMQTKTGSNLYPETNEALHVTANIMDKMSPVDGYIKDADTLVEHIEGHSNTTDIDIKSRQDRMEFTDINERFGNENTANYEHTELFKKGYKELEIGEEHYKDIIKETYAVKNTQVQRKQIKEEERLIIDESLWNENANEEVTKGRDAKNVREKGMDTIFCLDLSKSMKGEPLRQAKTFVRGFVEGIQNTQLGDDVFEHVALVTFGSETKVQQHLTCDYYEVLNRLDRLQPGGPTPMLAGLTMTWAAILGAGTVFSLNGYKMYPRVYLLSDGKITPSSFIAGPDSCTGEETKNEQSKMINQSVHLHMEYKLIINAVPVGEFDMGLLESVTKATGGKIISHENWKGESKTFSNYVKACSTGQSTELFKIMIDVTHADADDQAQMNDFLRTHKRQDDHGAATADRDEVRLGEEFDRYPPLGSRVKLKDPFASTLFGTVTKHFSDGVGVTWDHVNEDGILRVKINRLECIERVYEPRMLKGELIAEGCRVKRGKDWSYGDQDGKPGNEGSVFQVLENGSVFVRWDHNGRKDIYKFGDEGRFDLEIIQSHNKNSSMPTLTQSHNKNSRMPTVAQSHNKNSRMPTVAQSHNKNSRMPTVAQSHNKNSRMPTVAQSHNKNSSMPTITQSHNKNSSMPTIAQSHNKNSSMPTITQSHNKNSSMPTITQSHNKNSRKPNVTHPASEERIRNKNNSGAASNQESRWAWRDRDGSWNAYPPEIHKSIESSYHMNPSGSVLITFQNKQFKVVFSRMEQVDVNSGDKCSVSRDKGLRL